MRKEFMVFAGVTSLFVLGLGLIWQPFFWLFLPLNVFIAIGVSDMLQKSIPCGGISQYLAGDA